MVVNIREYSYIFCYMIKFKVVPKNTTVSFDYSEKGVRVRKGFSSNGGVHSLPDEVAESALFKYYVSRNIFSLVKEEVKEPEVKKETAKKTPMFSIHTEEAETVPEQVEAEPAKKRGRRKAEQE